MPSTSPIALTSIVTRSPDQVSGDIDAEAVLLSVENGKYYQMSLMGTHIWSRIEKPIQVATLVEQLLAEFEVERSVCEAEVLTFLSKLQAEHLAMVER